MDIEEIINTEALTVSNKIQMHLIREHIFCYFVFCSLTV